ncbi:Gfo/Idh/MocA family oxidoreductase [Vineibacter terrae]|uniref:Gfo/Idh/MocA family protein n=1 Tax=Vineibacter terrae TaxID=2586908 RepID=UPI002E33E919|nr:Gfo/Idh/MocA family oxidoreductase [Vineibacter terrae]HEX2890804.1 Gfo/Idh/MocA family oxidoreductase [Vineibacter terrae]
MATGVKRDTLRVLLAGHGAFGAVHAQAWAALGFAERLVIADPDPHARAQAQAALPQARVVSDWRMALPDVDVVDLVTPSNTHAAVAMAALDAGCDLLIEKPMTMNRAEAATVAARARQAERIVQVGYVLRAHPAARRLRDIVRAGDIGVPVWIDSAFLSLKRPRRDAGVVLNDAVHVIDLVLWTVGRTPDAVSAVLVEHLGRGVEDIASITLHWQDGPTARVDASCIVAGEHPDPYVAGGISRKHLSVTGDAGQAVADFMTGSVRWRPCRQQRSAGGGHEPVFGLEQVDTFTAPVPRDAVAAELESFVEAVLARRSPEADAGSGLAMAAVCDAVFAAARERRTVEVRA